MESSYEYCDQALGPIKYGKILEWQSDRQLLHRVVELLLNGKMIN
jgi:hypothetical protein